MRDFSRYMDTLVRYKHTAEFTASLINDLTDAIVTVHSAYPETDVWSNHAPAGGIQHRYVYFTTTDHPDGEVLHIDTIYPVPEIGENAERIMSFVIPLSKETLQILASIENLIADLANASTTASQGFDDTRKAEYHNDLMKMLYGDFLDMTIVRAVYELCDIEVDPDGEQQWMFYNGCRKIKHQEHIRHATIVEIVEHNEIKDISEIL